MSGFYPLFSSSQMRQCPGGASDAPY